MMGTLGAIIGGGLPSGTIIFLLAYAALRGSLKMTIPWYASLVCYVGVVLMCGLIALANKDPLEFSASFLLRSWGLPLAIALCLLGAAFSALGKKIEKN